MTTTNYKTNLLTLLAVLVLAFPQNVRTQQLQASLSHYSTENGLPSNTIAALRSDDYGYLWLVTWNGISRFDAASAAYITESTIWSWTKGRTCG